MVFSLLIALSNTVRPFRSYILAVVALKLFLMVTLLPVETGLGYNSNVLIAFLGRLFMPVVVVTFFIGYTI